MHTYTHSRLDIVTLLTLAWTLLTASQWTAGSSQILVKEPAIVLYPKIHSSESIECDCVNISCDTVYWFRTSPSEGKVQFVGKCNNADRVTYGTGFNSTYFKLSKRGSLSFVLRIVNVTEKDRGIYSCVLKEKLSTEMWKPGVQLLPGVTPPTEPPKTEPPVRPICCEKKRLATDGCASLVLWPLVGVTAGLALALSATLYYYSRLPKKCKHQFVKTRK